MRFEHRSRRLDIFLTHVVVEDGLGSTGEVMHLVVRDDDEPRQVISAEYADEAFAFWGYERAAVDDWETPPGWMLA